LAIAAALAFGVLLFGWSTAGQPNVAAGSTATPASVAEVLPTASSPPGVAPSSLDVIRVENALGSGLMGLTERYGATCFMGSFGLVYYPPDSRERLDVEIDAAALSGEAWLEVDRVWLGTMNRAADAFGAANLYVDPHETWMELSRDGTPMLAQLVSTTTPAGRTVWSILNTETVIPCE
jgi:hypothetical protein